MYHLSRLMCVAIFGLTCFVFAELAIIGLPWSLPVLAILLGLARKKKVYLTTLASSYWCTRKELEAAGMVGGNQGFILGRFDWGGWWENRVYANKGLLDWRLSSKEACSRFLSRKSPVIRLPPSTVHTATFAPTRVGKGRSIIVPFLLTCQDSCVAADFKGELALLTAKHRQAMGQDVYIVDPYDLVASKLGMEPATINVLDTIGGEEDREVIDKCNDLAKAIVVRGKESESFWNDRSENLLALLIALTAWYSDGNKRSIQTVAEVATDPEELSKCIAAAYHSKAWEVERC